MCMKEIEARGLEVEGLYRIPGYEIAIIRNNPFHFTTEFAV